MGHRKYTKSFQDKTGEFETRELIGYSFSVTGADDWPDTFAALGFNDSNDCQAYVRSEFSDRMYTKGGNPGTSYLRRLGTWSKFLEPLGTFAYTYSDRFWNHFGVEQLNVMATIHGRDSQSRQLILSVYDQRVDSARRLGISRVPCTMYYQFLESGDELILIDNMRSCDLYTHFPIDLSVAWLMVSEMAAQWEKKPKLIMQMGSLHAFKPAMEKRRIF